MKNLTVRNVPDDLAKALELEKRRREKSLNQTVDRTAESGARGRVGSAILRET